jgi:phosphoribosyl 1,2-cyclic phosphodiesterase
VFHPWLDGIHWRKSNERANGTGFSKQAAPRYNVSMRVISLQSGSNGNCIYVEAGGVKLLFDAGLSGIQVSQRLALHGRDVNAVDAVLISHDHVDHSRGMGVLHRKFGLPIYATVKTFTAARRYKVGEIADLRHFHSGETLRFGEVAVETIPTPHDAEDGVVFVVDDGTHRLGILTDLGHVFAGLPSVIDSLDAVLLESNYDPDMLANGSYPAWLKDRISGHAGHISNFEAAELLHKAASKRMQWACLGHLSQDNNTADLALATHRRILGGRLPLRVATRYAVSEVLEIY